jgi:hypothetical protein
MSMNGLGQSRYWWRVAGLVAGGILLQAAAGCEERLANAVSAFGQPVATGVGNGISSLFEALTLSLLV